MKSVNQVTMSVICFVTNTTEGFKLHNRENCFNLPQFSNITANLPELIICPKYPLQANLTAVISADMDYSLLFKWFLLLVSETQVLRVSAWQTAALLIGLMCCRNSENLIFIRLVALMCHCSDLRPVLPCDWGQQGHSDIKEIRDDVASCSGESLPPLKTNSFW